MRNSIAAVGMVLWLASSCGSSGSGNADGGSGGTTAADGAAHSGGSPGSGGSTGTGGGSASGGAGGVPTGTSGVTGSKALSSLTAAEKGKYCDWDASLWGGYNQTKACPPDDEVSNPDNQAACVAKFPNCAATVSQFETCSKKIASDPCNILAAATSPECSPLLACL